MSVDFSRPVLLQPFNALPLAHTPWAGQGIYRLLRPSPASKPERIGECWEFSCDPRYPARVMSTGTRLDRAIAAQPQAALSPALVARYGEQCRLLVKLINAAYPLSVQLHPALDANAPLAGKWESWLVLAAAADSKAYIGFNAPLNRAQLRTEIAQDALAKYLATVTLSKGCYLEIPPLTVHSLAGGAVVLEVQYLLQGRGGETLRLWDWGHKYNARGELDYQHGKARPLALARALPAIDPAQQQWQKLQARCSPPPREFLRTDTLTVLQLGANPYYRLFTVTATHPVAFTLHIADGYGIMFCLHGDWQLAQEKVCGYQPLFLPAALGEMTVASKGGEAVLIVPQPAEVFFTTQPSQASARA